MWKQVTNQILNPLTNQQSQPIHPSVKKSFSNQAKTLENISRVSCRFWNPAKLNVNTVLSHCTFQLKVQATAKGTRQLQRSHLRHISVYFLKVQKTLNLLKSFLCFRRFLFCNVQGPAVCHMTTSVPTGTVSITVTLTEESHSGHRLHAVPV